MSQHRYKIDSHLDRFLSAQEGVFDTAFRELKDGVKRSHWMWFIFPQIIGLGKSTTAQFYALLGVDEAKEYLQHPILGERLIKCTQVVLDHNGLTALDIFGSPDDVKFKSSMTLFDVVAPAGSVFSLALEKYYSGKRDELTLQIIKKQ